METAYAAERVGRRLLDLADRLGSELGPSLRSLLARLGFDDVAALLHPLGQPIIQIPLWTAEALAPRCPVADDQLLDLIEAAAAGYLHVRIQDDLVDGDAAGDPIRDMFLSDALLIRHQSLVAQAVGSPSRFWNRFEQLAFDYGHAMLFERGLHRDGTYSRTEFRQVMNRSMPLAIPALAVLELGSRWELAEDVVRFVRHAVTAGQLIDDLRDAVADFDAGRRTWVTVQLGSDHGRDAVLVSLGLGGFDRVIREVEREVEQARLVARRCGLMTATRWLEMRLAGVGMMRDSFAAALAAAPAPRKSRD